MGYYPPFKTFVIWPCSNRCTQCWEKVCFANGPAQDCHAVPSRIVLAYTVCEWWSLVKFVCLSNSVADPGCFIPDPTISSSRIRIQTFFHPGSYMKSGMQTFFSASYAFRSKVLVLVTVKKIPDPGGKKAPDPQHCSKFYHTAIFLIKLCNCTVTAFEIYIPIPV
jgi:hypothetical protein